MQTADWIQPKMLFVSSIYTGQAWPSMHQLCCAIGFLYEHYYSRTQPFNGPLSGTTRVSGNNNRKVKPIWILLNRDTVSGSSISWAICKSAPRIRQTSTPAPHHSVFYRPDALRATQPTASKHWRSKQFTQMHNEHKIKSVVFLSKDHHPNTYRKPPARLPDSTASHSESRRFNSYAYPETAAYVSHTRTTPNIHCRCFYGASNQPYTAHASQDNSRTLSLAGVGAISFV